MLLEAVAGEAAGGGAAGVAGALEVGDLLGDAAGVGDDAGEEGDEEGGQLAADEHDEAEDGQAAEVVGHAVAEHVVAALGVVGGGLAREAVVCDDVLDALLVEAQVGLALDEEALVERVGGVEAREVEGRGPGGGGRVGGLVGLGVLEVGGGLEGGRGGGGMGGVEADGGGIGPEWSRDKRLPVLLHVLS